MYVNQDCEAYPKECRPKLAKELAKFIDNDAHRRSVAMLDKVFNPRKLKRNGKKTSERKWAS